GSGGDGGGVKNRGDRGHLDGRGQGGRAGFRRGWMANPPRGIRRTTGKRTPSGDEGMGKAWSGSMLVMTLLVAVHLRTVSRGTDMEQKADQLWNDREDLGKAAEAIEAYEALRKDK